MARFVAAVVDLVNDEGFVDYHRVLHGGRTGTVQFGWTYYEGKDSVLDRVRRLAADHHPAMLATCICDLVPQNLLTRVGPTVDIKLRAKWAVEGKGRGKAPRLAADDRRFVSLEEQGVPALSAADADVDLGDVEEAAEFMTEKLLARGAPRDVVAAVVEAGRTLGFDSEEFEVAAMQILQGAHLAAARRGRGTVRGTPVSRVEFYGVRTPGLEADGVLLRNAQTHCSQPKNVRTPISRRMASFWRHHADYLEVRQRLLGLMRRTPPSAPSESASRVNKLVNAAWWRYMDRKDGRYFKLTATERAAAVEKYLAAIARVGAGEGRKVRTSLR